MKLTLRPGCGDCDWWVIERAEHDGRTWFEQTSYGSISFRSSARFSDADVEGNSDEMRGLAKAIRARGSYGAKRCAVTIGEDKAIFRSPRNSTMPGVTSLAEADELATQIETMLALGTPEQKAQNAYSRWQRGPQAQDPARGVAFGAGCLCHFLEGDSHHDTSCPAFQMDTAGFERYNDNHEEG